MLLAGRALETVRRQLQHEGSELKGSLWSLRGNAWNLSAERQKQRRDLCAQYTNLGRAMTLRETLQVIYASPDYGRLHLEHWRQPSRTGPRRGDFSVCPVTQPDAVKTVTIMNNAFDCLKVHDG